MSLSRDCGSRAEPAESQGGRHGTRISGPLHMERGATERALQGTTGGRDWCLWHPRAPMTWHPLFSFLPPSWRNPESHVLQLPAVWFLVAEDVICAHTNCPPPPQLQPVLSLPPVIVLSSPSFSLFSPLTHLRPWFSLTWYTSSASQSLVQGPGTWCNKIKTVHLPAGHSFKDSAQWGLSGCLQSSLLPAHFSVPPGTAAQAQAASLVCLHLFFTIMNLFLIRYVLHLFRSLKALRETAHAAYGTLDNNIPAEAHEEPGSSWTQLTKCCSPSVRNIHQRLRPSSSVAWLQPHLCISDLGAHHC